jgi:hypothetical protein
LRVCREVFVSTTLYLKCERFKASPRLLTKGQFLGVPQSIHDL